MQQGGKKREMKTAKLFNAILVLAGALFLLLYPVSSAIAVPTDDVAVLPEPGILILLGIAMTAVGVASRYVRKP